MNARFRSTPLLMAIAVLVAAGCRDQSSPTVPKSAPTKASSDIWDGAHDAPGLKGNDDVFFLPPMVANPSGKAGYGEAFQAGLPVAFKIRDMTTNGVIKEFAPAAVQVSVADEMYKANWDTKAVILLADHTYRIEAWIGSTKLAYADVDVVSNGSQLKNVDTDEFIPLLDGRTLPIKLRVEQGWNCHNNASCASEVVTNTPPPGETYTLVTTGDGENTVAFPANWFDVTQVPGGQVTVTVEDVSEALGRETGGCGLGVTTMLAHQRCVRITTDPEVVVQRPVIVQTCLDDIGNRSAQLLKFDTDEPPVFLRNVPPPIPCPEHIGANPFTNPIAKYAYAAASRVGRTIQRVLTPKMAYALDLGVGGEISAGDGFSIIGVGVPLSMTVVEGNGQSAHTDATVRQAPKVQLRYLHRPSVDIPVGPNNAVVTCTVTGGSGTLGGLTSARAFHDNEGDEDGEYSCPAWMLGPSPATNTIRVSAEGVDDVIRLASVEGTFAGSAVFTAYGLPTPQLTLKGIVSGEIFDRYLLTITNRAQYPDAIFAASPELPVCESISGASRTRVDVFRETGSLLNTFCTLSGAAGLDDITFSIPAGSTPPTTVSVALTDRKSNQVYTSNSIGFVPSLTAPADRAVFDIFPRTTVLSWTAVNGAASYDIERAFCGNGAPTPEECAWSEYPVANTTAAAFQFDFIGAQWGRWRVRARFAGDVAGPWTVYRFFFYSR